MGCNFDQTILIRLQQGGSDTKEDFTNASGIRQPNPPEAGGPPEPGITPATQSWTEAAMGNKWGTDYDPKWSRTASDGNGGVLTSNHKSIQLGFLNAF
jgi:hypothetical protein